MARKPAFITHSREREAQIQSRLLDVLEARFRRRIASVIVSEGQHILFVYRDAGYPPPVADEHYRAVRAVYREMALASIRAFGRRVVVQGKAAGFDLETKADGGFAGFFDALANLWINLEPIRRRITSVTETTRNQVVQIIAQGQADGLSVEAIARQIADRLPVLARQRARVIARTETHGAANFATNETAKTTGMALEKEWVAVEDMRTRRIVMDAEFDHASMDGQRVAMDEPFQMPWASGGALPIMYPGEAGQPGGAVINCRCAVVHHIMGGLLGD